jgi:hypothetical protein
VLKFAPFLLKIGELLVRQCCSTYLCHAQGRAFARWRERWLQRTFFSFRELGLARFSVLSAPDCSTVKEHSSCDHLLLIDGKTDEQSNYPSDKKLIELSKIKTQAHKQQAKGESTPSP